MKEDAASANCVCIPPPLRPTYLDGQTEQDSDPSDELVDKSSGKRSQADSEDPDQPEKADLEWVVAVRWIREEEGQGIPVALKDGCGKI